jgi:hypothetical protein
MTIAMRDIFQKPVDRPIDGVIKADDEASLRVELPYWGGWYQVPISQKASPPSELLAARVPSIGGSGRAGSFQGSYGKGRSARRHPSIAAVNAPEIEAVSPLYAAERICLAVFSRVSITEISRTGMCFHP